MKPSKKLLQAIQTYYFNRSRQGTVKWNKEADLDEISKLVPNGFSFEACTGTFWFIRRTKKYRIEYETSERTFPDFKKTKKLLDRDSAAW